VGKFTFLEIHLGYGVFKHFGKKIKNLMIVVTATQKIQDTGVASRMMGVMNFTPSSSLSCKCYKNTHL
jgi:hypothetical protein